MGNFFIGLVIGLPTGFLIQYLLDRRKIKNINGRSYKVLYEAEQRKNLDQEKRIKILYKDYKSMSSELDSLEITKRDLEINYDEASSEIRKLNSYINTLQIDLNNSKESLETYKEMYNETKIELDLLKKSK